MPECRFSLSCPSLAFQQYECPFRTTQDGPVYDSGRSAPFSFLSSFPPRPSPRTFQSGAPSARCPVRLHMPSLLTRSLVLERVAPPPHRPASPPTSLFLFPSALNRSPDGAIGQRSCCMEDVLLVDRSNVYAVVSSSPKMKCASRYRKRRSRCPMRCVRGSGNVRTRGPRVVNLSCNPSCHARCGNEVIHVAKLVLQASYIATQCT
ncbi:hypothetical protein C8Q79DRAFT_406484 [Trametes meyenii]|nr:hypothetical protein C8Q79DRAFT_406484 [Trametes meyenii]